MKNISEKIEYMHMCPDGFKAYYRISHYDLLTLEFLHETSLLDTNKITTNFIKRVNKIKEIAIQLNTTADFTKLYFIFKIEPYKLEETIKKYLPHLIV